MQKIRRLFKIILKLYKADNFTKIKNQLFFLVKKGWGGGFDEVGICIYDNEAAQSCFLPLVLSAGVQISGESGGNFFPEIPGISRCHIYWLQSMRGKPVGCSEEQSAGLNSCTYSLLEL